MLLLSSWGGGGVGGGGEGKDKAKGKNISPQSQDYLLSTEFMEPDLCWNRTEKGKNTKHRPTNKKFEQNFCFFGI